MVGVTGPLQAIEFYMEGKVDVFLGPVCDYALAPVARYTPYWNIPIISPGGMAHDFGVDKNKDYAYLTRIGPTFNSLATYMISLLDKWKWKKVS